MKEAEFTPDLQADYEDACDAIGAFISELPLDETAIASALVTLMIEGCENRADLKDLRNAIWRMGVQFLENKKCDT